MADPRPVTDPYWKRLLTLYRGLPPRQRKVVLEIMRQVQVDTVSELFGIFDGTSLPFAQASGLSEARHELFDLAQTILRRLAMSERWFLTTRVEW